MSTKQFKDYQTDRLLDQDSLPQLQQQQKQEDQDFLSPMSLKKKESNNVQVLFEKGSLEKRSILGTVGTFENVYKKRNLSNTVKKTGNQNNIKFHMMRHDQQNSLNTGNQSTKNSKHPKVSIIGTQINNKFIEELGNQIQIKINENEQIDQFQVKSLPKSVQMKLTSSERILNNYEHMKGYWNYQKEYLCSKSKKENPETALMSSPDQYRKRIEEREILEKSNTHVPHMGGIVWRSQLRYYQNEPKYNLNNKKRYNQSGYQLKQKGQLSIQEMAEKREATKTYLHLDSVQSSPDITSIFLDKHFSPTVIVRTPNIFSPVRGNQRNKLGINYNTELKNSLSYGNLDIIRKVSDLKHQTSNNYLYPILDISERLSHQSSMAQPNDISCDTKLGSQNTLTSELLQFHPSVKKSKFSNISNNPGPINIIENSINTNIPANESALRTSFFNTSMKRVREADSMLEKTVTDYKKNNETLICPGQEEDLQQLFVVGENVLQLEVDKAKKLGDPKFLLSKSTLVGEENIDGPEEIIALNYDAKIQY